MLKCFVFSGLYIVIYIAWFSVHVKPVLESSLMFNKAMEMNFSIHSTCILKGYSVTADMKTEESVKVKAALYWDLSIACMYVCIAPCQAWAASLPHKGHSLFAPGSGLPFNRRQTASCMCGQNNSTSSVGLNRELFVEQLSACLSETQPTHVWQWSNICAVCGTSHSKQWRAAVWNQSGISFRGSKLW